MKEKKKERKSKPKPNPSRLPARSLRNTVQAKASVTRGKLQALNGRQVCRKLPVVFACLLAYICVYVDVFFGHVSFLFVYLALRPFFKNNEESVLKIL